MNTPTTVGVAQQLQVLHARAQLIHATLKLDALIHTLTRAHRKALYRNLIATIDQAQTLTRARDTA